MLNFGFASEQEIRAELGQRLHAQRLTRGLSQDQLSQRSGISVSTVKLLESEGQCTLENFVRAVWGLGLIDELQPLFARKTMPVAQKEQTEKSE